MSLAVGTRLGPYEVLAKIGDGGMGEVYRARDTRLNRDVAVKIKSTSAQLSLFNVLLNWNPAAPPVSH
jgi:hypothetical protein